MHANKCMQSFNPARSWVPKDFFLGIGYQNHNLEGYVPKPEYLTGTLMILVYELTYLKGWFPLMLLS